MSSTALPSIGQGIQGTSHPNHTHRSSRIRMTQVRASLRVLIIEDSSDDAEMLELNLAQAGFAVSAQRVMTADDFLQSINTRDWDVVIADYTLPAFGALAALGLLKQSGRDIPFIIVSGSIGEETAVAAMRAGAHDYVLKDNMARLVPAIEREMRDAETRRRKSQADEAVRSLSAIVNSSDDAIIGKTLDGVITSWNPGAEHLYGYTADEMLGRPISILMPADCADDSGSILTKVGHGESVQQSEALRRKKDGTLVYVSIKISPVRDGSGRVTGASTIARDITEQKNAEAALLRSEKLAAVGRMAAVVAHEINNPLAAVTNLLYLTKALENLPEAALQNIEIADAELRRISHITQQSLGFYRESNGPAFTSVGEVMESAVDLLKSKIKAKHARIEKQWDRDVQISAVSGELRQVFCNLLFNSLDAIDHKGTVALRISMSSGIKNAHPHVRVTIADNGKGITAAARSHIFEPFFTTKGTVGTGLGLWVTKQIISKHGGNVRMRSSTSAGCSGTVFCIFLPIQSVQK
jgi:PAS domain S-box-containing protein